MTWREKDWMLALWDLYNETYNLTQLFVKQHERKPETVPKANAPTGIRLERLKFRSFNGNLRKYPKFKSEFLKHIRPLYKADEVSFVLKSYLSDDVREEVENLDDFAEMWTRLDRRYGDEGKHIDAIMSEIKDSPLCENEDIETLLRMINTIEKAHRDLSRLGLEKEISNSTIVSMIEEKMPCELQKEWLKIVTGTDQTSIARDKFPPLLKLLLEYRDRMEYKYSDMRSHDAWKGKVNLKSI